MRIDEQLIADRARQLRDRDNEQARVRPWTGGQRQRFRVPRWLVAVPAAAVAGFFFGMSIDRPQQDEGQLQTAMLQRDTVYVREVVTLYDTVTLTEQPAPRKTKAKPQHAAYTSRNIENDNINYSMLLLQ